MLVAFGLGAGALDGPVAAGVIDGLKVLAVAVVAHAVLGMARSLCPDLPRQIIALVALAALAVLGGPLAQLAVIGLGGLAGLALGGMPAVPETGGGLQGGPGRRAGLLLMGLAVGLFVAGPLMLAAGIGGQGLALFEAFYRAGALVFGGGHVVLPLLEASVVAPGWVTPEAFLAGYGATQAVPGPIFAFAGYLGAVSGPAPNGIAGAAIALVAIFLPGLLLMAGMLPFWQALRGRPRARAVLAGVNAAVVGVLAAALFDPVFLAGIGDAARFRAGGRGLRGAGGLAGAGGRGGGRDGAGRRAQGAGRDLRPRPGPSLRSGEEEIAGIEFGDAHVFQKQGIAVAEADQRVVAAVAGHEVEFVEGADVERGGQLDPVAAAEIADLVAARIEDEDIGAAAAIHVVVAVAAIDPVAAVCRRRGRPGRCRRAGCRCRRRHRCRRDRRRP